MLQFDGVICDRLEHCQNISLRFDGWDNYLWKYVCSHLADRNTCLFPLPHESIDPQLRDSDVRYVYLLLMRRTVCGPHLYPVFSAAVAV